MTMIGQQNSSNKKTTATSSGSRLQPKIKPKPLNIEKAVRELKLNNLVGTNQHNTKGIPGNNRNQQLSARLPKEDSLQGGDDSNSNNLKINVNKKGQQVFMIKKNNLAPQINTN